MPREDRLPTTGMQEAGLGGVSQLTGVQEATPRESVSQ